MDLDDVFIDDKEKSSDEPIRCKSLPDLGASASRILASPSCLGGRCKSFDSSSQRLRFSTKIDEHEIEALKEELSSVLFYNEDEIGTFRNEAFLESCGLDPADFADL